MVVLVILNIKTYNNHGILKTPEKKVICSDLKTHFSLSCFCLHFSELLSSALHPPQKGKSQNIRGCID